MSIKFFNVKSGETKEVDTEPAIAAYYNSGDKHVNALLGQDFGWRLAPETVKRIKEIKSDQRTLDRIAQAFSLPLGEVSDTDVLHWISMEDARKEAQKQQAVEGGFEQEYDEKIRELDKKSTKTDRTEQADSAKIEEPKTK